MRVLAVGDVAFQKKCLSRMESLSGHNRTVLFVSHHLGAIRQLCPRCLLLERGQFVQDGKTPDVVAAYNRLLRDVTVDVQTAMTDRLSRGTVAVRFTDVSVENAAGQKVWDFSSGETIRIRFSYRVFKAVSDLKFFFALRSNTHAETLTTASDVLSTSRWLPTRRARMSWKSSTTFFGQGTTPSIAGSARSWGSRTTISTRKTLPCRC